MSRRSLLLTLGVLFGLAGGGAVVLVGMIRYEHHWYSRAGLPPGPMRTQRSREFTTEFFDFLSAVNGERDERGWYATFTDEQINSYFDEGFIQSGLDTRLLPEGVSEPRVAFEAPDRIRLAFRYGKGAWSTLISIDLRVWLASRELNAVALELEGFHAGALPISAQSLLEQFSLVVGKQNGMELNWYRDPESGHPVAVLHFQTDYRNNVQLQAVQLDQGSITIRGRSNDGSAIQALSTLPGLTFLASRE
jgi:hypothetical protein